MSDALDDGACSPVVNVDEVPEETHLNGEHWGGHHKKLTPSMRPHGGMLGVRQLRVPPGRTAYPFHAHLREDEAFFILSGQGLLRYGDDLHPLRPGDCVSCPAGTGKAHQIVNTSGHEDLIYLSIGNRDPHEVCTYPDNGKVLVRGIDKIGLLEERAYLDGEPEVPKIVGMISKEG